MLPAPSRVMSINAMKHMRAGRLPSPDEVSPNVTEPSTDEEEEEESLSSDLAVPSSPYKPLKAGSSIFGKLLPRIVTPEKPMVQKLLRTFPKIHGSDSLLETKPSTSIDSCLVYLIRHGEASHNVLEKKAQQQAKEEAEAEGLPPSEVEERMEAARVAVLCDESLRDASLSEQGRQDARRARRELEDIICKKGLSRP
eukprot:CAMPEP_0176009410 /NCGR_PEP_ID=MMETSP0120_2-20121206/4236_1 /TAXON_ID=160619 /ORGANISM="Kryptoperidinium foliaceum, Strain CCMP 1326" /LENGTH=196 /DNA_ID=CAMNT_0017342205 /DNA_START=233 /DNA_END=820 /DNA_ORIENTATION=+